MPAYDFECDKCETVTEDSFPISKRPPHIKCPKCGGKAVRIFTVNSKHNAESRVIWSKAFGINPDQIPEMMKRFPGDEYNPVTGAMRVKGFQHQKKVAKRLGMVID